MTNKLLNIFGKEHLIPKMNSFLKEINFKLDERLRINKGNY